jgi:transaldolase
MKSQLEQLRKITTVVADTGDIEAISKYTPEDATTKPFLILKATKILAYEKYIYETVGYNKAQSTYLA